VTDPAAHRQSPSHAVRNHSSPLRLATVLRAAQRTITAPLAARGTTMRSLLLGLSALLLATTMSACGTYRSYGLPVGHNEAPSTFAQIRFAAEQQGYTAIVFKDSVNVKLDDATWVYFRVEPQDFKMIVTVDDDKVVPEQREAKVIEGKAKGDAIWAKAMEVRRDTGIITLVH
jgi:hypothetical protein